MDFTMDMAGFSPGLVLMIVIPLIILQFVLLISALVSVLKKPVAGNEKLIWVLIIVFVNIIGPILYFAVGSSMLDAKASKEGNQN